MKIGYAGPITLEMLPLMGHVLPSSYHYPLGSALVNAILDRGHEVVCFTSSKSVNRPQTFKSSSARLIVCVVPQYRGDAYMFYARMRRDLACLIDEYRPDLINAHWTYEFSLSSLDSNLPVLVTVRDDGWTIFRTHAHKHYWFMRWVIGLRVFKKANFLSVNSQYLLGILKPMQRAKARVIPNFYGSDVSKSSNLKSRKEDCLVTVGNGFCGRKNIAQALRAFSILRSRNEMNLEYHLIGEELEEGGVAWEHAKANNLMDGVRFLGRLSYDETMQKIASARVLLHPSLEESFGMTLLEGMVLGTPVIGGEESGNVPHLLDHGRAGWLCNVSSAEAMASTLCEVFTKPDETQRRVEYGKQFAYENYSAERCVEQYLQYYEDILASNES